MRNLKYIKLFEAFESDQLNKTMKFVKKTDRPKLLDAIKSIAKSIDAPISALSDEFFQYLPYKKAIALKSSSEKEECPSCEGVGRVSKAWGTGTRMVKCTTCNGTGTVDTKPKPKYFKFWFDSDGSFVGTTVIDGRYHMNKSDANSLVKKDITEDMRTLSVPEIKSKYKIVNGVTKIYVENVARIYRGSERKSCLGKAFIDRDGDFYVVNSSVDTHSMPTGRKYREYGNYAVDVIRSARDTINGADTPFRIYLTSETEEKEDIFWNAPVAFLGNGTWSIVEEMFKGFLKDAHFAIVFDFDAFKQKEFAPVSATKGEREESRKGAAALMSNDDIKKANIDRYIKTLTSVDLGEGISKLVSKVPKIFGGDLALYYIFSEKNFSRFRNMLNDVYKFMSANSDEEKAVINRRLSDRVQDIFEDSKEIDKRLVRRIANARKEFEGNQALTRIIDKLEEMSKRINQKLLKGNIETVQDMEIMLMKAGGIKEAMRSDRFEIDYYIKSYIEYLSSTGWRGDGVSVDALRQFPAREVEKAIRNLDMIMSLIDRL